MSRAETYSDTKDPAGIAPHGAFALHGALQQLVALTRHTVAGRGHLRKLAIKVVINQRQDAFDVEVRGLKMRLFPKDNSVESKLLLRPDKYCAIELAQLEKALGDDAAFVDIGANIGAFTLPLAAKSGRQVIAVEPNPRAADRLAFNLAANGLTGVVLDRQAISDRREVTEFTADDTDIKLSGISAPHADGPRISVQAKPLIDLYEEHGITGPSVLKIDIEGHENKALLPFFDAMPRTRWPRFVVIEAIEREGFPTCIEVMRGLGYKDVFKTSANLALTLTV